MLDKLRIIKQRFDEVSDLIIQPDIMSDQKRYIKINKEYKDLSAVMKIGDEYTALLNNIEEAKEIIADGSDEEMTEMAKAPFSLDAYKKALDLKDVWGEKGYSTMERNSIRPTLDVNGIWGGYIGEGAKTVIASKAYAKISMRLVPHQKPEKITALFEKHFTKINYCNYIKKGKTHYIKFSLKF